MSHYHKNQFPSASNSHSSKTELSGLKHRKIIPGDYEPAWSPTSPLDFRMLTSFANPFGGIRGSTSSSSSQSIRKRQKKSWDSEKVGLGIVDSLDSSRTLLPSTESKNIIFGSSLMRSGNPKCPKPHHIPNPILEICPSLSNPFPKTPLFKVVDVVELGTTSSYCSNVVNENNSNASEIEMKLTDSEIEMSEDYTRVITHGSNPQITHFYGDQVLESVVHNEVKKDCCHEKERESIFEIASLPLTTPDEFSPPPSDFLSFCCFCSKKLVSKKNIYMYRGYKAFCSEECRMEEIIMDDIMEEEEEEIAESSGKGMSKKKGNGEFFTVG